MTEGTSVPLYSLLSSRLSGDLSLGDTAPQGQARAIRVAKEPAWLPLSEGIVCIFTVQRPQENQP